MMKINWHRLFGLMLMDYFSDRGFRVELEKDLSQKRQYLDVVIVERKDEEANLSGKSDDIRLYAISTRRPSSLLSLTRATEVKPGVWDIRVLNLDIRILVLNGLPLEQRNAVLAFFSFNAEKVRFALEHYEWRMEDGSTVINQLLSNYSLEGIAMPYTMEQFRKDYMKAHLPELNPDEVLSMFTPEDRLKGLAPKDRLEGLAPEEIEAYLKKLKMKTVH